MNDIKGGDSRGLMILKIHLMFHSDCQLDAFTGLQNVEKEIQKSVNQVVDIGKKTDIGIIGSQKDILDNVVLSGSITEGTAMSALFKPTKSGDINKELQVGVTFDILQIPEKYRDLVEDVKGRDGFVKVRVDCFSGLEFEQLLTRFLLIVFVSI